jgi:hypothetical protein
MLQHSYALPLASRTRSLKCIPCFLSSRIRSQQQYRSFLRPPQFGHARSHCAPPCSSNGTHMSFRRVAPHLQPSVSSLLLQLLSLSVSVAAAGGFGLLQRSKTAAQALQALHTGIWQLLPFTTYPRPWHTAPLTAAFSFAGVLTSTCCVLFSIGNTRLLLLMLSVCAMGMLQPLIRALHSSNNSSTPARGASDIVLEGCHLALLLSWRPMSTFTHTCHTTMLILWSVHFLGILAGLCVPRYVAASNLSPQFVAG